MPDGIEERTYELEGVVQGIGLRPLLFRLARQHDLGGLARNRSGRVQWCLQGPATAIEACVAELALTFPQAGQLAALRETSRQPCSHVTPFAIVPSEIDPDPVVQIPPDLATCPACRDEIFDRANRRYGYAFTSCTLCGPRYTVVERMPYDRERTTLRRFPLCPACRAEYEDPDDRRFHAESTACPVCGPRLWIEDAGGRTLEVDPLPHAREALAGGAIVAVRGIGGFLLAVDASNPGAVRRLRERKARPHKPLAVMARDMIRVRAACHTDAAAEASLHSSVAPIVILPLRQEVAGLDTDAVSPDLTTLGVMLPASPLHELLMHPLVGDPVPAFDYLVMTSGNHRGEPICIACAEARARLTGIADCFLMHNREINLRNDDSLAVIRGEAIQIWRRARGLAPAPVNLPSPLKRSVLALGAELKNAIAVGAGTRIVLSPHVGDLDTPEAVTALRRTTHELPRFLSCQPACIAVDLHPDMQSTQVGEALAKAQGLPIVRVQHHHAHAAACLAEHGRRHGVVLTFDGTGLGRDGSIWGAEVLELGEDNVIRRATFAPVPLPGGDAAVRDPRRQLTARCLAYSIPYDPTWQRTLALSEATFTQWQEQCRLALNAPLTHAAGRLFDSISVLLGLAAIPMTYDGQPAIRLEAAAEQCTASTLPELPVATEEQNGCLQVDWGPMFRRLVTLRARHEPPILAMAAHHAIASAAMQMIDFALTHAPHREVGLSGGVFMNAILTRLVTDALRDRGIEVLAHRLTPPGDGCIALGQAVIAGMAG